jgi:hypothetical protein
VIQTDGLWATPWGTALAYVTRNQHPTFSGQSESLQWRWQSAARPADTGGSWSWSTVAQTTRRGQGHSVLSSNTPSGASRDNGIRLSALTPGGLSTSISAAQRSAVATLRQTTRKHWACRFANHWTGAGALKPPSDGSRIRCVSIIFSASAYAFQAKDKPTVRRYEPPLVTKARTGACKQTQKPLASQPWRARTHPGASWQVPGMATPAKKPACGVRWSHRALILPH